MRCGKEFLPGGLSYVIRIQAYADFDGTLPEPEEGVDEELRRALREAERTDPAELEKEVFEELSLLLCKRCRDRLLSEVRQFREGPFRIRKNPDEIIH